MSFVRVCINKEYGMSEHLSLAFCVTIIRPNFTAEHCDIVDSCTGLSKPIQNVLSPVPSSWETYLQVDCPASHNLKRLM